MRDEHNNEFEIDCPIRPVLPAVVNTGKNNKWHYRSFEDQSFQDYVYSFTQINGLGIALHHVSIETIRKIDAYLRDSKELRGYGHDVYAFPCAYDDNRNAVAYWWGAILYPINKGKDLATMFDTPLPERDWHGAEDDIVNVPSIALRIVLGHVIDEIIAKDETDVLSIKRANVPEPYREAFDEETASALQNQPGLRLVSMFTQDGRWNNSGPKLHDGMFGGPQTELVRVRRSGKRNQ